MRPKFGDPRISMREAILFYKDLTRKTDFFEGWCWFKLINLRLAPGMTLKFYSSVTKRLKPKLRSFLGPIHMFREETEEKQGASSSSHYLRILNRVNDLLVDVSSNVTIYAYDTTPC